MTNLAMQLHCFAVASGIRWTVQAWLTLALAQCLGFVCALTALLGISSMLCHSLVLGV